MNVNIYLPTVAFVVSLLSAAWIHPKVVRIACLKNITDCPDERKLHRTPVPVLGGVVVFLGIIMGLGLTGFCYANQEIVFWMAMMLLMLYTGTMDDIMGLTAKTRFIIEIVAALIIIYVGGYCIGNFHGLWGIYKLPVYVGVPLTVMTVVGIINAINLIDGVNGLSSGYSILACLVFGKTFIDMQSLSMVLVAVSSIGALIPFFVHNVFGRRQRMFIGDGGTLMMGMLLSMFVLRLLGTVGLPESVEAANIHYDFGKIAFCLAVLSIPVFDTLRVMSQRIIRGKSPFSADKTHLHHFFIECGLSHFKTTLCILSLNLLIIACWYVLYRCGMSQEVQLYSVIILSVAFTMGVSGLMKKAALKKKKSEKTEQ